jgi:hypothetical protein
MNAQELKENVRCLMEDYCANQNGDFKYTIKEKEVFFACADFHDMVEVSIFYIDEIDSAGIPKLNHETFYYWNGSEKITTLQDYVFETLDRIHKAELIDYRKDDPTI